jgi:hypothetical protein
MFDPQIHTLPNDLFRDSGAGQHEYCIRFFRYGSQVRKARRAIECGYARVDCVDPIAMLFEYFVIFISAGFALIRNAYYCDYLLRQKILYKIIDFCHEIIPS